MLTTSFHQAISHDDAENFPVCGKPPHHIEQSAPHTNVNVAVSNYVP